MTQFFSNRNEYIISNLNNRIYAIEEAYSHISNGIQKDRILELYKEVSYFIHYIQSESILSQIFSELINLNKKSESKSDYLESIEKARKLCFNIFKELTQNFSNDERIKRLGKFANPFIEYNITDLSYEFSAFPILFSDSSKITLNLNSIEITLHIINKILQNIQDSENITSLSILTNLDKLNVIYKTIKYQIEFMGDYIGTNAAIDLFKLYKAINPNLSYGISSDEKSLETFINSGQGEPIHPYKEILKNCYKVQNYICSQISLNLLKNVSIERFKTFVELYRIPEFSKYKKEIQFQRELEQFLFLQGFYPLSEIQFKNIRTDILAIQSDNVVLYEIKLIKEKQHINPKIKGANYQANRYYGILNSLPNIVPEVHIILFSLLPCIIINKANFLQNDNINFYFHLINLCDQNVSSTSDYSKIDINNFL